MTASMHLFTGALLVLVGIVLVVAFGDTEFGWFRGQPLGIVLAVFGLVDLGQGYAQRRRER